MERIPRWTRRLFIRDADTPCTGRRRRRDACACSTRRCGTRATQRVELERDLRHSDESEELHLLYQPLVQLPMGTIEGFEALLRGRNPSRGSSSRRRSFRSRRTRSHRADRPWVIEEACRQLAGGATISRRRDLYVAVNLSVRQLLATRSSSRAFAKGAEGREAPRRVAHPRAHRELAHGHPAAAAELLEQLRSRASVSRSTTSAPGIVALGPCALPVRPREDRPVLHRGLDRDTSDESLVRGNRRHGQCVACDDRRRGSSVRAGQTSPQLAATWPKATSTSRPSRRHPCPPSSSIRRRPSLHLKVVPDIGTA